MFEVSIPRIQRYAAGLGVGGTVAAGLIGGIETGAGFAVGAAIALTTISSWSRLASSLNPEAGGQTTDGEGKKKPSVGGSALFLALRYVLIGGAIYATIKVLGVSPVAMLLGLLVSFVAVVIEIAQQASKR